MSVMKRQTGHNFESSVMGRTGDCVTHIVREHIFVVLIFECLPGLAIRYNSLHSTDSRYTLVVQPPTRTSTPTRYLK